MIPYTVYRGVKIFEDHNPHDGKITIIFPNKSRVNIPFILKKEKQIKQTDVKFHTDLEMFPFGMLACLILPIIIGFQFIAFDFWVATIVSLIIFWLVITLDRWLYKKKEKENGEIYFEHVDVRDNQKERMIVDKYIDEYNPDAILPHPLYPSAIRNV